MTPPYTPAEFDLAAKLYAEHAGYDIANRLPLRCRDPWHQRQWVAVARLAVRLIKERGVDEACVRIGFPAPLEIPSPPIGAAVVLHPGSHDRPPSSARSSTCAGRCAPDAGRGRC